MNVQEIIEELNKRVSERFGNNFKGSYLYGSRAKGNFNINSDIDVIVLFETIPSNDDQLDLAGIVGDVEYDYDVFIDYHPYTLPELEHNPVFFGEVVHKGIYYGKAA